MLFGALVVEPNGGDGVLKACADAAEQVRRVPDRCHCRVGDRFGKAADALAIS